MSDAPLIKGGLKGGLRGDRHPPYQGGIKGGLKAKSIFNLIITSYLVSVIGCFLNRGKYWEPASTLASK
ncbi:MAG: hypothetical protein EWV64_14465 [Microcystis flos-aquae Ma_QC_C_20070823_S18]|uniref:Uncharacterized protein n=2 Tax=Microcystis flos-aquae TaxID=109615 RepID=A0A552L5Y1_9CHRO|nr:MAG: hypothetical protein EWV64_14465 [Microcystis flos-aquae Ma_QC_C_20070823_S18]TRU03084.1 MAG: hypothetical protein EWV65_01310 [Microcystis flos-aquae Ma_QC_C_20070823_S18D]TRV09739.1 MAG: hypothetical protein EWV45_15020 [Microcystis flos-aquae Mf_QC_C_20070823_S10D]TRV15612.1 MAG: hypothetical protein EWV40_21260 [Microcystis flos-aquae Mf_WU_F_19750830_S460]TRV25878.1 MAG: hypothetical protein EWV72_08440 [Microcystis flos-aquae Mf_QC_C_20070823_S10]TRV30778.1 MAG: hypothetical prot